MDFDPGDVFTKARERLLQMFGGPAFQGFLAVDAAGGVDLQLESGVELEGDLGRLEGAASIPLDELRGRASELSRDKPIAVVCQTGKRSALGATILARAGVERVANIGGGMLRWRELGLPS